jgi:hypothetical protein
VLVTDTDTRTATRQLYSFLVVLRADKELTIDDCFIKITIFTYAYWMVVDWPDRNLPDSKYRNLIFRTARNFLKVDTVTYGTEKRFKVETYQRRNFSWIAHTVARTTNNPYHAPVNQKPEQNKQKHLKA